MHGVTFISTDQYIKHSGNMEVLQLLIVSKMSTIGTNRSTVPYKM